MEVSGKSVAVLRKSFSEVFKQKRCSLQERFEIEISDLFFRPGHVMWCGFPCFDHPLKRHNGHGVPSIVALIASVIYMNWMDPVVWHKMCLENHTKHLKHYKPSWPCSEIYEGFLHKTVVSLSFRRCSVAGALNFKGGAPRGLNWSIFEWRTVVFAPGNSPKKFKNR